MDILIILGVVLGVLAVVGGMLAKGASLAVLLNPAAAIVIGVGTIAVLLNSFPKSEVIRIPKLLGILFINRKLTEPKEIIDQVMALAQTARRDGLLSLETAAANIDNELLKRGLRMAVDGCEQEFIREVLNNEIEAMEERHRIGAMIFTSAGSYAPTLGVLGAVIGLIGALGNLNDMEKLGHMIAAAFVATLYGIFLGYVICHPFATRLKQKSSKEVLINRMIVEGALSIQTGESPALIKEKLIGLLPPAQRKKLEAEYEEGSVQKELKENVQ